MTAHFHWVVWIDHQEARMISFNRDDSDEQILRAQSPGGHLHHHAGDGGDGREAIDPHFFATLAAHLASAGEILLVGPGQAKQTFVAYLRKQQPALAAKVVKVEALDHQSDGQLLAYARKAFHGIDRMLPQR